MKRKLLGILAVVILAIIFPGGDFSPRSQCGGGIALAESGGAGGAQDLRADLREDFIRYADQLLETMPNSSTVLNIPGYYTNQQDNRKAVASLEKDARAALILSLAYRLTGLDKYAIKATDFMVAWSSNCREAKGRESKFHLVYRGFRFLRAYQYLEMFDWNRGPFEIWLRCVYRPAAEDIKKSSNNFGSWGRLGCIMVDSILAPEFLDEDADDLEAHIKQSIGSGGVLIHETKRTLSGIWYSYFSLTPIFRAAMELDRRGSRNLYSLMLPGFDWFFQYCVDPDSWPYRPQPGFFGKIQMKIWPHSGYLQRPNAKNGWPANLLEVAATVYVRPRWLGWINPPGINGCYCFEYSSLVKSMRGAGMDIEY